LTTARVPVAILGAGGYIGQHFARLLDDHPSFEVTALGAGERSVGRTLGEVWQLAEAPPAGLERHRLEPLAARRLAGLGVRVVFSALPSGTAGPLESELVRRGISVFTNASDHRLDARVPLLVPEVNAGHLELLRHLPRRRGLLVADPNCSAAGLVLALAPIWRRLDPRAVHVSTYQALSGAGFPGVPSLAIADNVVPFIESEEEKVARESARLLGRRRGARIHPRTTPFVVHCARVATREGHLEAVTVDARGTPKLAEIVADWTTFDPLRGLALPTAPHPPVEVRRERDRPQPVRDRWAGHPARARGMAAVVGRLRWEPPYFRFFVLSHNAVRGGAGGSVLNAELALARGLLDGRGAPPR